MGHWNASMSWRSCLGSDRFMNGTDGTSQRKICNCLFFVVIYCWYVCQFAISFSLRISLVSSPFKASSKNVKLIGQVSAGHDEARSGAIFLINITSYRYNCHPLPKSPAYWKRWIPSCRCRSRMAQSCDTLHTLHAFHKGLFLYHTRGYLEVQTNRLAFRQISNLLNNNNDNNIIRIKDNI